jgi:hypothetical protein
VHACEPGRLCGLQCSGLPSLLHVLISECHGVAYVSPGLFWVGLETRRLFVLV